MLRLAPRYQLKLWPHTIISYAAGVLWPTNSMMVSWNGFILASVQKQQSYRTLSSSLLSAVFPIFRKIIGPLTAWPRLRRPESSATVLSDLSRSSRVLNEMVRLESRSHEVEATIFLMNVTVMTEPVVFYDLRWCGGYKISIYRRFRSPRHLCYQLLLLIHATSFVLIGPN